MNDEKQGAWTLIWENGTRDVGPFVNDERQGTWTVTSDDGSRGEEPYVNGEKHGTWTLFHEGRDNNAIRETGPYASDERHGTWTGYDSSGDVVGTLRFENGRRVGDSGFAGEAGVAATLTPLQVSSPAARSPPGGGQ